MELIYENEIGRVKMYGGKGKTFNICKIEGLEPVSKTRKMQSYVGEDGLVENSSQFNQRIITLRADYLCRDENKQELKKALRIFTQKGILYIKNNSNEHKKITVNDVSVTLGEEYNKYITFVLQMTCDYPHFNDAEDTIIPLYQKRDYLSKTSGFPLVLTHRISNGVIENQGDVKIYPTIIIKKDRECQAENTILITNHTTNKSLLFNKSLELGEQIVVDIKNRKVTSSVCGNIIDTLDRELSLSDMWCETGINEFSVHIDGKDVGVSVLINYNNEYTEAL